MISLFPMGCGVNLCLNSSVEFVTRGKFSPNFRCYRFSFHSPGKNTRVGCHAFLQGVFPAQRLNPGLAHCGQILYHLSLQGSPGRLEWVAYPFSSRSCLPRNRTRVSCATGSFFTSRATTKPL